MVIPKAGPAMLDSRLQFYAQQFVLRSLKGIRHVRLRVIMKLQNEKEQDFTSGQAAKGAIGEKGGITVVVKDANVWT